MIRQRFAETTFLLAAVFIPSTFDAGASFAQESLVIAGEPTCDECRIQLELVATLGDADGPGYVGNPNGFAVDPQGRYYVSHTDAPYQVFVFDSDGTFLTVLGGRGGGPGEFGLIRAVEVDAKANVHVLDGASSRWTIFSPDYEHVKTVRIPGSPISAVPGPDGTLILNAVVRTAELAGLPIHILEATGDRVRSFGSDVASYRYDIPYDGWRWLAPAADSDRFWAAPLTEYRIQQWDINGHMHADLVRRVEWFQPHRSGPSFRHDEEPPPRIGAIWQDGDGLLWVAVTVPATDWEKAFVPSQERVGAYEFTHYSDYYETILEVIDLDSRQVLASQRVPYLKRIAGAGLGAAPVVNGLIPRINVWRIRLTRTTRS